MAKKKSENKTEINRLLACIGELISIAKVIGVDTLRTKINNIIVAESDQIRKQIITVIIDEVSKHFNIQSEELKSGKRYIYKNPRLIAYKLMYMHTDLKVDNIAMYFNKTTNWVHKKILQFDKLKCEVTVDREILQTYDKIFKKVAFRVAAIEQNNCLSLNESETENTNLIEKEN